VSIDVSTRIADGMACRTPVEEALTAIRAGVDRLVEVTDDEIEEAMRAIYEDTHSVAEGAGAAGLAALLQERDRMRGQSVGIVLTGGNVDSEPFARVLMGGRPPVQSFFTGTAT
jgi:threonine dehydratase